MIVIDDAKDLEEKKIKEYIEKSEDINFKINDLVVCPVHGIGKIIDINEEDIMGELLSFYIIEINTKKITLRIPVNKIAGSGVRHISDQSVIKNIIKYLSEDFVAKNIMWNKKNQKFEQKVNSPNIFDTLSIIKEFYHTKNKADAQLMTFSENQIYKVALKRCTEEMSLILSIDESEAEKMIFNALDKNIFTNEFC